MSLFSKLFGGGGGAKQSAAEPVDYEGYRIFPEPMAEDGQFRLAARIEKDIDGATKTHKLIRADLIRDRDEAIEAAVRKAKQMIDQTGDAMFD